MNRQMPSTCSLLTLLRRICVPWIFLLGNGAQANVVLDARELVENQHRILVLRDAANLEVQSEARKAGQYLFFRNQQIGRKMVEEITHSPQDMPMRYCELTSILDEPTYSDEDRLGFRSLLEALSRRLPSAEQRDANLRLEQLSQLRKSLGANFDTAFQRVPLRPGHAHSSRWIDYVDKIKQGTTPQKILSELERELVVAPEAMTEQPEAAARAHVLEWNGEELPAKTVLLTFDDGPHPIHTPAVLDILKEYGVHSIFFQIGRNLGEVINGVAVPGHNQPVVSRLLLEGHAVGNHSFTHPVLPKLDKQNIALEIAETQALIESMVPQGVGRSGGFRPPYGARNERVLAEIELHHLRSVVWNIDSEDWADPLPESIAHRIVQEAEKSGRGIVLMHDIHARTVEALPVVIRELKKRGFQFARWDGERLVVDSLPIN